MSLCPRFVCLRNYHAILRSINRVHQGWVLEIFYKQPCNVNNQQPRFLPASVILVRGRPCSLSLHCPVPVSFDASVPVLGGHAWTVLGILGILALPALILAINSTDWLSLRLTLFGGHAHWPQTEVELQISEQTYYNHCIFFHWNHSNLCFDMAFYHYDLFSSKWATIIVI